jgi:hypothetical protein
MVVFDIINNTKCMYVHLIKKISYLFKSNIKLDI